jgi:hypothetical protein
LEHPKAGLRVAFGEHTGDAHGRPDQKDDRADDEQCLRDGISGHGTPLNDDDVLIAMSGGF